MNSWMKIQKVRSRRVPSTGASIFMELEWATLPAYGWDVFNSPSFLLLGFYGGVII